jgi:hypothetical protein
MSIFGLIEENMALSHIHLAVESIRFIFDKSQKFGLVRNLPL